MNYRYSSIFDVSGTKSMRLSARKIFDEYGGNAQNRDEAFRAFVIPDPGKLLFQVDQAGAEALIVANLAGPGNYKRLFELDIKPHTYLALNIFVDKFRGKKPASYYKFLKPDDLVALPEWPDLNISILNSGIPYLLGKKTAHAKPYGMRANTFRMNVLLESKGTIVLSYQDAKMFLGTYDLLFPEVIAWQESVINQVACTRTLYNLFGFPRTFWGRLNGELEREALSYISQSTVACLTSMAFTDLEAHSLENNLAWDALINAHDAVVGQAPVDEVKEACRFVQRSLARDIQGPSGIINMKSEAVVGKSWNKKEMTKV